jgi:glycosyltransferase involved in cell wall biosynthesis
MRILLLSAYDADSHIYWREGLVRNLSEHDWTVLSLPGRYFSWRMRGNSLSWAFGEAETLSKPYDLVIATSMTDLSSLRGFVPSLANTPTLVYFHENQFAYPSSGKEFKSVEPCILNLYTALSADYCLFNSEYNRRTLLEGAEALLAKLPDHVPAGIVERIEERSCVLPVPLNEDSFLEHRERTGEFHITWNHRWEFDKNPQLLLDSMIKLDQAGVDFTLHVVGQQFRKMPKQFEQLKTQLGPKIGHWGYMESRSAYQTLLQQSDVVLSTALHDYQGIAVLEGAAAGAYPVVPDRLAYTELFPKECRYESFDKNVNQVENEAVSLAKALETLIKNKQAGVHIEKVDVSHLEWSVLAENYRQIITQIAVEK